MVTVATVARDRRGAADARDGAQSASATTIATIPRTAATINIPRRGPRRESGWPEPGSADPARP
jgi:hypothetical protein